MSNAGIARGSVAGKTRRGLDVLRDPILNRGTGFTEAEREARGLRGLLPPHVHTQDEQATRADVKKPECIACRF